MAAEGLLDKAMGTPTLDVGFGEDTTEAILWQIQLFNWGKQRPRYVLLLVGNNGIAHSTLRHLLGDPTANDISQSPDFRDEHSATRRERGRSSGGRQNPRLKPCTKTVGAFQRIFIHRCA